MAGLLQAMKDLYFGPPPAKGLMQDLEYNLRTKGGLTPDEDTTLRIANYSTKAFFVLFGGLGSYFGWFAIGLGNKLLGFPYTPAFHRFFLATGCAYILGKGMYRGALHACPAVLLDTKEGRIKMEAVLISLMMRPDQFLERQLRTTDHLET